MERPDTTTPRIRGTTERVDAAARTLRRRETAAERVLWESLRGRKLAGLKFRRQHPVGPFVLDFYCPDCKLAVEEDGDVHDDRDAREQDAFRTSYVAAYGYRVLHVRNVDIPNDLPNVLSKISDLAQTNTPPLQEFGEGVGGRQRQGEGSLLGVLPQERQGDVEKRLAVVEVQRVARVGDADGRGVDEARDEGGGVVGVDHAAPVRVAVDEECR